MSTIEKKELTKVQNVETKNNVLTESIVSPKLDLLKESVNSTNEVKRTLSEDLKVQISLINDILNLELKKVEIRNFCENKQLSTKVKNDLLKDINTKLKSIKEIAKVEILVKKESSKKERTEKQTFVLSVCENSRSLSSLINAIKKANKGINRYSFLYKKTFNLSLINSFLSLNQFNRLLRNGDFYTESEIVTILDKIEKIEDFKLLELYTNKGQLIKDVYKSYLSGAINFEGALKEFTKL
jgi:hypothetical protein